MNKQGTALIFGILVILVLSILSASFFLRSMNENNLVRRHVNSTRALWLAEAGVAEAIADLPTTSSKTGTLGGPKFQYNYNSQDIGCASCNPGESVYKIESTGSIIDTDVNRTIEAYVKLSPPVPGDFAGAIEVQGDLKIKGNPEINGPILPNSIFTFEGRFGISPEELRNITEIEGHYYEDPPSPLQNFHGLNWVKITDPNDQLKIPRTGWTGSGILIVEGETEIEGGTFNGIIWVIGQLTITGNPVITGTVISESGTEINTKLAGTPTLTHSQDEISAALDLLTSHAKRTVLTWREL